MIEKFNLKRGICDSLFFINENDYILNRWRGELQRRRSSPDRINIRAHEQRWILKFWSFWYSAKSNLNVKGG